MFAGLDSESIWSELELRNVPLEKHTKKTLARLLQSEDMSLAADIASDEEAEGREEASDGEEADDGDADMEGGDSTALLLGGGSVSDGDDDAKGEVDGEDGSDADGDERDTSAFKARGKGDKATGTTKSSKQAKNQKTEDMFFDADDMEKFADEGTMDDDDLEDGVLDEMYGGGGGDADSGEEKDQEDDSDEEDDAEMMEELMQEEAESEDEQVGGGIKHEDFFDDGDDGDKPRSKRRLSKKKQSSRRQQEEEEEGGAESDGDDVDDGEDGDASDDEGEEEEEEETGVLSAHVQHSRRMKSKISDQERELLAEKPWALRGEVHSHDRPQNSLLEATVDVERATRVAPPPTAEHAMTLLDMIKKRCLDSNWDDVTPRDLQGPTVRKEAPHLSQDKSKEGLGELYEKEFLKKTMGVTEDDPQKGLKNELKHLFSKLCGKLDALCNFHYTPKAAIPEMKVQADVAAIAMEEVLPSSVADAEALAPEELYKKKRGREAEFLEGGAEMSQEDRKRSRSSKKAVRRKARRQAEAAQKLVSKLNPGLGNKYEKAKMMRDIQGAKNVTTATGGEESTGREFSTSAKFFSQLQESVTASVKSTGKGMDGDAKDTSKKAAQLRL
ncbi:conserved unknown protein [Ectocarpus siliculosus]|uniref:U3 small nucleolar ribonucleoprotein protein MPP10 n=1 Tax=Ectocarpus siliculosus TaxID=2880 RepID=D7FTX9_ECTSI|nr:conserved unknown protein [Ectocarpus siliculosus]|eukprot:CBJ31506.1 conserved unknown protein [Ectocarpus siliculosus]